MFKGKELRQIRDKAIKEANAKGTNPNWVRAYQQLADSANTLDAMIARCTVKADE